LLHDFLAALIGRGHARRSRWRNAKRLECRGHRVRRELTATGARAGARDLFELIEFRVVHLPDSVFADGLVDVADRDVLALEPSGHDRPAVDHETWDVHARERHDGAGDGLVAAADAYERIKEMPAGHELDGVGDDLARDERGFHAFGAHRDAV